VLGERTPQLLGRLGAEGPNGLLDEIVKQLLDEGGLRLFARREKRRQLAGAVKIDFLAGQRLVEAGIVDRLVLLLRSISARGVVYVPVKSRAG
jgi:hypothetical protein